MPSNVQAVSPSIAARSASLKLGVSRMCSTAVIRPGTVGRQVATAMGRTELQARKAIQRPLKNEMGERDGGFERIADDVAQQAIALEPFLEARHPLGMEENQGNGLL